MDEFLFLRQRGSLTEGSFPRGMDDILLRQQQLLRQEQHQGQQQQRHASMMHDFGLSSLGQSAGVAAAATMPSLQEISRAEEILAAARDAITASSAGRTVNQFSGFPDEFSSARSMLNQPEARWASAYGPGPLRAPGNPANAPISSVLGNQDLQQLLLSKQGQAVSLATAHAQQQSPMTILQRQAMMNQMPSENMGVLESLLMRQEEERLIMGKRQRSSLGLGDDDSSPRPKKWPASGRASFPGMASQPLPPPMMHGDTMMPQQGFDVRPRPRKRRAKTFPVKLMETLMSNYDERYVAWLPDGKSFVIIHPEEFVNRVLSSAFKNSKYASFVRKLNRWGFARLTSGTGTDCFYHPLFQRDRMDLAAQMLCMPRNDSASAKKRAQLGIETPAPRIITAADVNPKDRPSLAGVERFVAKKGVGDESSDSDGGASPDYRKEAAASSGPGAATLSHKGEKSPTAM